ncbi:alanyl-tRNA editing protein [Haloplanus aerogenes]|uniref:Alanyl-tRNA editing protein n=1 Tax=Haloplanus aerogenes TaxID=660522 RepID=A0A3M0DR12_9EURY|nr:alanyl-tRNA editing protein [Haloplanus aerogenes]AZH24304.1 alanyl-tRNA editing protein [Haloplanus aerogenes]RMB24062.1 misacylated tRNA(Ala) deacylase [Haloplanus aerogenes]
MTDLRYLPDADDVTEFEATVTETGDDYVVLDGTYFYPGGGGQPADRGTLSWSGGEAVVVDARKNHGDVRHYVDAADGDLPAEGTTVTGRIDAERRDRLTRLHTAQHVLSRVVLDEFGAATVGNGLTVDGGWVEFEGADLGDDQVATVERLTNAAIERDLPVQKVERPRSAVEEVVPDGRAQIDAIPDFVDPMRVVEIDDFDVCPCGGTHVDRLGEVGTVRITDRSRSDGVERLAFDVA